MSKLPREQVNASTTRVSLEHVSISYGRSAADSFTAVRDVSLEIPNQEFVSVIGSSGCGKSTLLKAITGLIPGRQIGGRVTVNGKSPLAARRANEFSVVFQDPVLAPWRTALDNVRLPLEVIKNLKRDREAPSPEDLLSLVGLAGFEGAMPSELSGGMRQRVAIARALTVHPSVLLMDEPFGALDEMTRDRMQNELLRIWSTTDAAVIFVTHSLTEAAFLSDRVVVMSPRPGQVLDVIHVPFDRPRDPRLKSEVAFLGKVNEIRAALGVHHDNSAH